MSPRAESREHPLGHVLDRVRGTIRRQERRERLVRRSAWSATAIAVCALAVGLWKAAHAPAPTGVLATAEGVTLREGSTLDRGTMHLSDGSTLAISDSAALTVLENSPRRFHTRLRRGRVGFDVDSATQHGRHWIVAAGSTEVEVVGTRFVVDRRAEDLLISVERGTVRVRGPLVDGGSRTLKANGSITVLFEPERASANASEEAAALAQPEETEPGSGERAREGSGPVEIERQRVEGRSLSEEALARSDQLRRAGRYREAASVLEDALVRVPRGRPAALLALTLGRIRLNQLGEPRGAGQAFERAIRLGLPSVLAEQALARAVHAYTMAGDSQRAISLARSYLQQYPEGPNRDLVLRRLERPREL